MAVIGSLMKFLHGGNGDQKESGRGSNGKEYFLTSKGRRTFRRISPVRRRARARTRARSRITGKSKVETIRLEGSKYF